MTSQLPHEQWICIELSSETNDVLVMKYQKGKKIAKTLYSSMQNVANE